MVDNSQGHSAYKEDTLVISHMNVNPGGKQARMHDTWFMQDGTRVVQKMVFPPDHPEYLGQLKGIKELLKEQGLYKACLRGKCKKCPTDNDNCCSKKILGLQEDFLQQKSLVQEVIEMAGHLCIFCQNFIVN
jgi:hypothetical protein